MNKKYDDISGKKYGRLLVISYSGTKTVGIKSKQTQTTWFCRCDCGVEKVVAAHDLKRGSTVSCGCHRADQRSSIPRFKDLSRKRFGRLIVVSHAGTRQIESGKKISQWLCKCDCGNEITTNSHSLRFRITQSCGCLLTDYQNRRKRPPGHSARNEVILRYKSRSLERCQKWALTEEYVFWLFEQNCHYCGEAPSLTRRIRKKNGSIDEFTFSTIDRLDSSRGYEVNNCVPACLSCNSQKQDKGYLEYFEWLKDKQ